MTKTQKNLLRKSVICDSIQEFLGSFVFMYISLYIMQHVCITDVSASNLVECILGFIILHLCSQVKNIDRIIDNIEFVEIILSICSIAIALLIVDNPAIAIVLIAINRTFIQHLLGCGFGAMYNRIYHGDDRSIMINKMQQWRTLARGLAGLLVISIGDMNILIVLKIYLVMTVLLTIMDLIQIKWIKSVLKEITEQ